MISSTLSRYALPTLVAAALLSSCGTPGRTYRLAPTSSDTRWYKGKEYAKTDRNDVTAAAAFIRTNDWQGTALEFDMWIANNSGREILVSPERFYYRLVSSPDGRPSVVDSVGPIHAIDPERRLKEFDAALEGEMSDYTTLALINTVGNVVDAFVTLAVASKTSEEKQEERRSAEEIRQLREQEEHEERMRTLREQKREWETSALRKTTLGPNETIAGHVLFPLRPDASCIRLVLPVFDSSLTVVFRQSVSEE